MYYKDIIFTDHIQQRIKQRGLDFEQVWQTIKYPDHQIRTKTGSPGFKKSFGDFTITVIAKQNEKYEYVLVSAWREPPLAGTEDARKRKNWQDYKKAGIWGKIWINIKQQLGI